MKRERSQGDAEHFLTAAGQANVSVSSKFNVCLLARANTAAAANIRHRAVSESQQTGLTMTLNLFIAIR